MQDYEQPNVIIITFDTSDIVRTSNPSDSEDNVGGTPEIWG